MSHITLIDTHPLSDAAHGHPLFQLEDDRAALAVLYCIDYRSWPPDQSHSPSPPSQTSSIENTTYRSWMPQPLMTYVMMNVASLMGWSISS